MTPNKLMLLAGVVATLAGCGFGQVPPAPQLLDLGSPPAQTEAASTTRAPVAVATVSTVGTLQSQKVIWRIGPEGQPNAYANVRWASPPSVMVRERLFDRLSLDGPVLTQEINAEMAQLKTSLLAFEQIFSADGRRSKGVVTLQVVLIVNTEVIDQIRVTRRIQADEPTAEAGARALRTATDQAVDVVAKWVAKWVAKSVAKSVANRVTTQTTETLPRS